MKLIVISCVLLCILLAKNSFCQENLLKNEFTLMFYNTENFYDSEKDTLTRDDEFTAQGIRRWTPGRMHKKAERISKVIVAAGKWNSPVLVGLCEIEDLHVLELLTQTAPLKKYHYKIVHKDSPDIRGIDVALLYRPDLFRPFDYNAIPVIDPNNWSFKTRDILQVSGVLMDCDTLHVFVNHWPSRYGGIMETIRYRKLAAETLKEAVGHMRSRIPSAKIVCMGDFNDTPTDESIAVYLGAKEADDPAIKGELVNLSFGWQANPVKTIKSQYKWEVFDQYIVSDNFLENKGCIRFLNAEIFDAGFLLEPDIKFGGVKPKRTYVGYKYREGFSDHLPVLLRVQMSDH
jgi:hypothetical protein